MCVASTQVATRRIVEPSHLSTINQLAHLRRRSRNTPCSILCPLMLCPLMLCPLMLGRHLKYLRQSIYEYSKPAPHSLAIHKSLCMRKLGEHIILNLSSILEYSTSGVFWNILNQRHSRWNNVSILEYMGWIQLVGSLK